MGNFLCLHQQDHQEEHQQEHQQDSTNLDSHIPAALCSSPPDGIDVNIFSYQEMSDATGSWDNGKIIGRGGCGCVYKGVLRPVYHNDIQVAIKKNHTILNGDMEWLREIKILGKFRHPNLVKLIGYCCEDDYRILVYEYMENGSLDNFLFRDQANVLSWPRRMKIALHAARGLAFLHGQERPIICRDFKPANILLDKDFHEKIADLGSAIEEPEQSDMYTRPAGTVGYIAPEYAAEGNLTKYCDIYSFGNVLLELLSGRRVREHPSYPGMQHLQKAENFLSLVDFRGQHPEDTALVARLGFQCINQNPMERPEMSEIVEVLERVQEDAQ